MHSGALPGTRRARASRPELPARPRPVGQAGVALIESLIAVVLVSIVAVAILGTVFTAIKTSALHRRMATAEVVARNFASAVDGAPYVHCAQPSAYTSPPGFDLPAGFTVSVDSIEDWQGDNPATFAAFGSGCTSDSGLQRVTYTVTGTSGVGAGTVRSRTVLKRYSGTIDDSFGPVPGRGVRCTITAIEDASPTEAAPTQTSGDLDTMDVNAAAGSRQTALLRMPIVAGSTPCAEGGTVPVGMQVRSATLRVFTWDVVGAVDCANSCWHALERVTGTWGESTATWNDRPTLDTPSTLVFAHGSGSGDFGPRYQLITGPELTQDVATFYALPSYNRGWSINPACAPTYPGRTCPTDPVTFRMRTSEWGTPAERPLLSIVFAPVLTSAVQVRNIAFGTCASVFDNNLGDASKVVAMSCAGKGNQAWTYDSTVKRFQGLNSGRCMETGNVSSGKPDVGLWGCHDGAWQKWTRSGSEIQYVPDPTKCLEIRDGNQALGTRLTIDTCDGSPEQQWLVEPLMVTPPPSAEIVLRNSAGANCVDVDIKESMGGVRPALWTQGFPCLGPDRLSQTFRYTADNRLVSSANSGLCLDGTSGNAGDMVTVDNCHQGANQQWEFSGGALRNLKNGRCLEGGQDIRWLKLQACASTAAQTWLMDPATAPPTAEIVQVRNLKFGDCMEPFSYPNNSVKVIGIPCDGTRPLQPLVRLSNGELRSRAKLDACLHVAGGSKGGVVDFYQCDQMPPDNSSSNTHQQWDVTSGQQLKNRKNGFCAQGYGLGTNSYLRDCSTIDDQKWDLGPPSTGTSAAQQYRSAGSGSCLDGYDSGWGRMWPCSGPKRPTQAVLLLGDSYLRKADDLGQCLDVQSNGNDGAWVRWIGCNGGSYQQWTVLTVPAFPGEVQLKTKSPQGRCLQASSDTGAAIMKTCDGNVANQRWIVGNPTDSRSLVQVRNGTANVCMDVNGLPNQGTNLVVQACDSNRASQTFVTLNNGGFTTSDIPSSFCLDVNNGGPVGAALMTWPCNNGASQVFVTTGNKLAIGTTGRCEELRTMITPNGVWSQNCATAEPALSRQTWFVEARP